MSDLIQIDSGYFVAGIELNQNDRVVHAAPILKYMMNWSKDRVLSYCKRKGWQSKENIQKF